MLIVFYRTLGSGTGFFSKFIVDQIKETKITLVDKSSDMLNKSMEILNDHQNINYILRDIRCDKILYGAFETTKFNKIIIFYAFQYFVSNVNDIENFALKLKKNITENGEVVIMIHNSFIKDKKNKNKGNWKDPIRKTITEYAKEKGIIVKDQTHHKFTVNEIRTGFSRAGFYILESIETKKYDRTILDRIAMWKVPAILNSLIEVIGRKGNEL